MKQITLNEYRQVLLIILKEIDAYCKKERITYFLDSGTLLGAVRHQGFIPWDDDIDLVMPRSDYERFITSFISEHCKVITFKNNGQYYYPYAKVVYRNSIVIEIELPQISGMGINIDIFPLDGMPDSLLRRRIHQDALMGLNKTRALVIRLKKKLPRPITYCIRWKMLVRLLDRMAQKYTMGNSAFCGNIVATTVRHKEIPIGCFQSVDYLLFEGNLYPVPSGYDVYLQNLYGDYLRLPPKEKQVVQHNIEAYLE